MLRCLVLRKLLEQWLSAVEIFADGNTVYLPYDFSDQYTAWLRCIRSDIVVEVCRGWAEKEGWAIAPSAIGEYLTQLPGFQPLGPTVLVSYNELLDAIRNMLK